MTSVLREYQYELLYPSGETALLFGTEDTQYLTLTPPQIEGGGEGTLGDQNRPGEDGRAFGTDFLTGKSISFEMGVLTDRASTDQDVIHRANLDAIDLMSSVWEDRRFRDGTGTVGTLRSCQAGTTYRCFGRPRNFAEATGMFTRKGYTPVTAEFHLVDNNWYSDTLNSSTMRLVVPTGHGLIGPLKSPLSSALVTDANTGITVGGTAATWPVIIFHGPVTNPSMWINNATGKILVKVNGSLKAGETLTIDPRPWARTVLRSDRASLAGWLTAGSTMMRDMLLYPGVYDLHYTGTDPTVTSYVEVQWRDARARP